MLQMLAVFSRKNFFTLILLFLPVLIIVSWLNVFLGNINFSIDKFLTLYVLPTFVVTFIISLITAKDLDSGYTYTYKRIIFTFAAVTGALFLYSYFMNFFGFQSIFLVLRMSQEIDQSMQTELASKFYSFELLYTLIALVVFYSLSTHLFKVADINTQEKTIVKKVKKKKSAKSKIQKRTSSAKTKPVKKTEKKTLRKLSKKTVRKGAKKK